MTNSMYSTQFSGRDLSNPLKPPPEGSAGSEPAGPAILPNGSSYGERDGSRSFKLGGRVKRLPPSICQVPVENRCYRQST